MCCGRGGKTEWYDGIMIAKERRGVASLPPWEGPPEGDIIY